VFIVWVIAKVTVTSCSFHINIVQCDVYFAGRRTQAGNATDYGVINEMVWQFATLSDISQGVG